MAQNEPLTVTLKIQNIESFTRLVNALGTWADEVNEKETLTDAERELFDAAVELSDG